MTNAPGPRPPTTPYFLSIYCGTAVALLLIGAVVTRQRGLLLVAAIAGVSYFFAIGAPMRLLFDLGIRSLRYPERFIAAGLITLIGFAAIVANRLLEGDIRLRRAALVAGVIVALGSLVAAALATPFFVIPAFIAAIWALVIFRAGKQRLWYAVTIIVLLADLAPFANQVMARMPRWFFTPPPIVATLDRDYPAFAVFHRGEWAHRDLAALYGRVPVTTRNALRPYSPASWGIRTVLEADFDETALLPTHDLLDAMLRLGNSGFPRWSVPFVAMSNVRHVIDYRRDGTIEAPITIGRAADQGRYWFASSMIPARDFDPFVRANSVVGVAFVEQPFKPAPGRVVSWRETSNAATIDVESTGTAFLVITVTRHKYWRATIDGREAPLVAANIAYQGLVVPAGRHRVEMRYRNPVVAVGGAVSGLTLILFLAAPLIRCFAAPSPRTRGEGTR